MTSISPGGSPDFTKGTSEWRNRLGLMRDLVRQELVHRQLVSHLPGVADVDDVRILDVGCGQGTQLLRLARKGYHVTGLDPSEELLDVLSDALAAEPDEVGARVRLHKGRLNDWNEVGENFDVVCCHGVVMYLPSLAEAITALVAAARPQGLISVLSKNRASLPFRAAMREDWEEALAAFGARWYTNTLGLEGTRADDPEEVMGEFSRAGAETIAWYGVRLFTDHWGNSPPPDNLDTIVQVEEEAGRRDPYRRLASATHFIARRSRASQR